MAIFNTQLQEQLKKGIAEGKLKINYPDGYKVWKEKFDYWYSKTQDVHQVLNIMYGPGGGVNDYKGSIYTNSNLEINKIILSRKNKKFNKQPVKNSNVFNFLKLKETK